MLSRLILRNKKHKYFCCLHQSNSGKDQENLTNLKDNKLGGFAKALKKQKNIETLINNPIKEPSFATLLRNSKFIDLGDPQDRIVSGTIFHIVNDDLYIDFGWKFHCVCPRPSKNGSDYVRGARVKLKIKDLELSTKFLGSDKDLTILEADATLLGLIHSP